MPNSLSLSHRSLVSTSSSLSDNMRQPYVPPEMNAAPMQYTNRSCAHSPTEMLPCARRILKTTKLDDAVTHTWVSCRGTRYVSTTMPLLHGVSEEQMARDAALFGHTRAEHRDYRQQQRPVSPMSNSRPASLRTDSETRSEASATSEISTPPLQAPPPARTRHAPSFAFSPR